MAKITVNVGVFCQLSTTLTVSQNCTKTKEIMHCDVFGYLMKNSLFLHP